MMKLASLSLLVASASAFSVIPHQTTKSSALFYYRMESRFDLIGDQKAQVLAEKQGKAILQGGSAIDWHQGHDECDLEHFLHDPSCYSIEPSHDVMDAHGSLVNHENFGPAVVSGGSHNDWQQAGGIPAPYYQQTMAGGAGSIPAAVAAAPAAATHAPAPTSGSYLDQL